MEFKELLSQRISNFWGYGNFAGAVWHVGMEEGLGDSAEDFKNRIENTYNNELLDIVEGMPGVKDHLRWFEGRPSVQPTWGGMIRIQLNIEGEECDTEKVRDYQAKNFGRYGSNNCVLDLMPLPSKSIGHWDYNQYNLPDLEDRSTYLNVVKPRRITRLKELIKEHKPKCILFYSKSYESDWKQIIGKEITNISEDVINIIEEKSPQLKDKIILKKHPPSCVC